MSRMPWPDGGRRLLLVVGPSGAGKDAVIAQWLASLPDDIRPHRAHRTITRPADRHESHESIDVAGFLRAQAQGQFAVVWQAHGLNYGVRWRELAALSRGDWVVLNGSRAHLSALRALAPALRVVEITAAAAVRAERLGHREREAVADRQARLARVVEPFYADCRIVNEHTLRDAVAQLQGWWQMQRCEETL